MMSEVKPVFIEVRRPLSDADPGHVELGFYIFDGGVVTLTTEDGTPLRRGSSQTLSTRTAKQDGSLWSATVPPGHDDAMVAGRLLSSKFSSQRSGSDFNRPLPGPAPGWR